MARPSYTTGIDNSPHREEIIHLLARKVGQKPTYEELARIIKERFGEEYTADQLMYYRNKNLAPAEKIDNVITQTELERRRAKVDVIAERMELLEYQKARLLEALRFEREQSEGGVPVGDERSRREIQLMNILLDALKRDQQDLGQMGRAAQDIRVKFESSIEEARRILNELGDSEGRS